MRMMLTDVQLAAQVKAKAKRRAKESKVSAPRHIKDVSDEELDAMPRREVERLGGVSVKKATIFSRMKYEDMSLREAAQTPPRTPRKNKPSLSAKRRFCGHER